MLRNRDGLGWIGRLILLAAVVGIFWGLVYPNFLAPDLPAPFTPAIVERGDFVEVDYIGWFPDTGQTFDTSVETVAQDNATYPKAASFRYRMGTSRYEPLAFTVGCEGGAGCPITGFQDAVLGAHVGDAIRVVLAPEDAYGPSNPDRIKVRPLLEDVPATETLTVAEFRERYVVQPLDGQVVTDLEWRWNVTVRLSGDLVTIRHSPDLGQVVRVAGQWDAEVVAIDDGANEGEGVVRLHHRLIPADVGSFVASDDRGDFIVVALDTVDGTYTVDYNPQVVGRTLAFEVTVKTLRKAP